MATKRDLDQLLDRFVSEGLSGCAFILTQHGETIYEHYAGLTEASVFRLASMSKIPMYTVMMMLYERGFFNLTDPVGEYLPEWKESRKYVRSPNGALQIEKTSRPITISDVMSMKCGLPYCHSSAKTDNPTLASMQDCMKPLWERGHYTLQEHVRAMSQAVLAFEPGTHWIYGFSSEIAAALIEVLTGKSIDEAMKELLFDPLEMKDTASRFFGDIPERMVTMDSEISDPAMLEMLRKMDQKHLPGEQYDAGWGRLFSTARDFSHLMSMLSCHGVYKGKQIIGRKTIDLMRSNGLNRTQLQDFSDPYNAGYGYGYGVRTLIDPAAGNHNGSPGCFGWTGGFGTWAEADPQEEVGMVYMHNRIPNGELYFHHLVRVVAYGLLE